MPRKLKTFVTTSGFFDLAVAAPSMKAALEIWGSKSNLFQQGFAKETNDTSIVKATMAQPGTVLKRPVGDGGAFKEHAEPPKLSTLQSGMKRRPAELPAKKPTKKAPVRHNKAALGQAAKLYDLAQKPREQEARRAEAQREKEELLREQAITKAQAALDEARADHENRVAELDRESEALERKKRAEEQRWRDEKEKLGKALRRTREYDESGRNLSSQALRAGPLGGRNGKH